MAITLSNVPPDKTSSAASFFNCFRIFSTRVGTAFGNAFGPSRTVSHSQFPVEELNPRKPGKGSAFESLLDFAAGSEAAMWGVAERLPNIQLQALGLAGTFTQLAKMIIPIVLLVSFLPANA